MFISDSIEGIDILRNEIPDELQFWHNFRNISELHYRHIFDNKYCDEIGCIDLFLTDRQNKYTIHLYLYNVEGSFSFDICNGFYSGLTIDDLADSGYESNHRFRITSSEQDIDFEIYCEKIKAELV